VSKKEITLKEVESVGIGEASAQEYARFQPWEDNSVSMLMATRGMVDIRVWRSHDRILYPMNQKRVKFDVVGEEVAEAYNNLFKTATTHPTSRDWPWLLTTEEDNTPEPEALFKLLKAIRHCPDCKVPIGNDKFCPDGHRAYDGLSGLYWTKCDPPAPMAFGNIDDPKDFSTQNVWPYMQAEDPLDQVIEVNSIPMGFTLYRSDIVKELSEPWFKTADPELTYGGENRGSVGQDIWFCIKAKAELGSRFGVHCGAKVGHLDPKSGRVY